MNSLSFNVNNVPRIYRVKVVWSDDEHDLGTVTCLDNEVRGIKERITNTYLDTFDEAVMVEMWPA